MTEKTQIVFTAKDETRAAIASALRGLESLKASGAGLANTFASIGAGGGLIGLIGGAGMLATLKESINELDKLNQSAERLGVSATKFEQLDFAGKLAGLEDGDMEKALTKISVKLEEAAAGSKSAIAWFDKLGVSWKDAAGNVKTADKAFDDVSEKISNMEDGTGKVAILVDGFGEKLGRKLAPALNAGAKGLESVRKELELLGGQGKSLDDLAKQADEFNDSMDKLSFYSKAAGRSIVGELLPSLNDTTAAMLRLASEGNGALAILRGIAGIGKLPFDLLVSSKPDVSVDTQISDLKSKLSSMEHWEGQAANNTGVVGQFLFGKPGKYAQEILVTKNQIAALEKFRDKLDFKPKTPETHDKRPGGLPSEDKPKKTKAQADDAERLLKNLREQIAVNEADLQSVEKLSGAEKERAKTLYQLDTGTLKATASQREAILAAYGTLAANEKLLATQEDYRKALEGAESSNLKNRQGMLEQIAAAEKAAELFGLNAAQISVVEQARLADAIAIARENGATEDMLAAMEEELRLRGQLSDALIKGETKNQEKKDAEDAIKALSEMDQFTIQAARNMQDAFADFFMNFDKGTDDMAQQFGQTLKKMIAEAASAQLLNTLFGDMAKTGKVGGLFGRLITAFGFHEGGVAGAPGSETFTRAVPASMFTRARRYHSGGLVGDEVPAILRKGELVLTKEQQQAAASRNASQPLQLVQNFYGQAEPAQVKRAAAAGMRSVNGALASAARYR